MLKLRFSVTNLLWLTLIFSFVCCSVYKPRRNENIEDFALKLVIANVDDLNRLTGDLKTIHYKYVHSDTASIHRYGWMNHWIHDSLFKENLVYSKNIYNFKNPPIKKIPEFYQLLLKKDKGDGDYDSNAEALVVRVVGSYETDLGTLVLINKEWYGFRGVDFFVLFDKNRKYLRTVISAYQS
jgi:hypothetical protein